MPQKMSFSGIYDTKNNIGLFEQVQNIIDSGRLDEISNPEWKHFLKYTSRPDFLEHLKDSKMRNDWAEQVFKIIQHIEFSLLDLFEQRVEEIPEKVLFQDMSKNPTDYWTYEQTYRLIRQTAAVFHQAAPENPRVAIYSENSVHSAVSDLACLFYDIFDSPLSTHFKVEILLPIFDSLKINIAVCDTRDRLKTLLELKQKTKQTFSIFTLDPAIASESKDASYIGNAIMNLSNQEVEEILSKRQRKPINQVATTMFTSGSTGIPKGVSFSIYNLVSKRFARHAALPSVGRNEVLLCFLPLFHTFGRYLELLGMIYWRGTYTFAGNTSQETLLSLFPEIKPSGFISVPIRWLQIYEAIQDKTAMLPASADISEIITSITGNRLRWGLSAAGYLDPKIFSFFEKNGINLSSGFGMTEATGGITMTPPGAYRKNSTGILLPGTKGKLLETGELSISGHYIAHYLEDKGPDDQIPYPENEITDYWMNTGDVFTISEDGYFEIIDRVKDIYKNNKGQTVAPKTLEKKFEGVPGIKQTFLVGDGKPFNVLLIVPDFKSNIVQKAIKESNLNEYFHQIVMHANSDLANYERVVNFSILSREFSADKGELTPKGSFNRKTIQEHYKGLIESLYQKDHISLRFQNTEVRIPRWFYRDIGILENDIEQTSGGLYNRRNKKSLSIESLGNKQFLIGDLIYTILDELIDLGRLTRQPRLWIGNPELIDFAPVKDGWDLPLKQFSQQVLRPYQLKKINQTGEFPQLTDIKDSRVNELNRLVCKAIFCENEISLQATLELGKWLNNVEQKMELVVRRRLEVLARHHQEEIRVLAYRILLLAEPDPDFEQIFPAFIHSGLSFISEASINDIAKGSFERQHLVSFRKRLYYYRTNMQWPTTPVIREQFINILKLLYNFGCHNISYYMPVRSEMASWILHHDEPEISKLAEEYFFKLFDNFDAWLKKRSPSYSMKDLEERVVYENGISKEEINTINALFIDTLFLDQSVILAFEELDFNIFHVQKKGMWISRLMSYHNYRHYRLSINTTYAKHYELHMVVSKEIDKNPDYSQLYWLSSLSGHPFGNQTLPTLGCSRIKQGIRTTKYLGELTVWEKIREYSEIDNFATGNVSGNIWRKLFIKAFSIFFITLKNSNFRIIPGSVSPNNVVVPVMDFRETSSIITLSGMEPYTGPLSIVKPIVKEFYQKTEAHYPWVKGQMQISWIFDACIEAFDVKTAALFLETLAKQLEDEPLYFAGNLTLSDELAKYRKNMDLFYFPLSLHNAIGRYSEWEGRTFGASVGAKEQTIFELYELYKLQDLPQVARYFLFRETYFRKSPHKLLSIFDQLIHKMRLSPHQSPMQMVELSDLQSQMKTPEDKTIFSKMVFPKIRQEQKLDILRIKADTKEQVVVRSKLYDKNGEEYNFREPLEPGEIGQLYQLFYKEDFPIVISKMDKHLVVSDKNERIVGGLCYKLLEDLTVVLDGSVISSPLQGKGIGSAMVEDFFTRMASLGIKVIKAHFLLGNYYLKNKFQADKKWGAFVKYL